MGAKREVKGELWWSSRLPSNSSGMGCTLPQDKMISLGIYIF